MDNLNDEIVFVVRRLAKAVSKHGAKKVISVLDKLNNEEAFVESHKALIKFIMKETSKEFQVNPEDMKRQNIRGIKVDARSMCFVLLKKHLDLKHEDIAGLFGSKNHSIVSNALRKFSNLDYNVKTDRKFLDIFRDIDKRVDEHKDMLWLKHS